VLVHHRIFKIITVKTTSLHTGIIVHEFLEIPIKTLFIINTVCCTSEKDGVDFWPTLYNFSIIWPKVYSILDNCNMHEIS